LTNFIVMPPSGLCRTDLRSCRLVNGGSAACRHNQSASRKASNLSSGAVSDVVAVSDGVSDARHQRVSRIVVGGLHIGARDAAMRPPDQRKVCAAQVAKDRHKLSLSVGDAWSPGNTGVSLAGAHARRTTRQIDRARQNASFQGVLRRCIKERYARRCSLPSDVTIRCEVRSAYIFNVVRRLIA
jgi:hypothetical protein